MTIFEIRNNMAYASHMQFEVLRRALWFQQAQPQTVFDWKFWEKAARDPKMTAYLNHGVQAKTCEATPFVNSVGSQYVAARAQIEGACDSLRSPGQALSTCIGLSEGVVHPTIDSNEHIAKSLLKDVTCTWSKPSSNGIAERMVGILKSNVHRMLEQAHLDREWWSYACRFAGRMMREKVLGRDWTYPLFGQLVGV